MHKLSTTGSRFTIRINIWLMYSGYVGNIMRRIHGCPPPASHPPL